ncbi:DUF3278 domain-containing protein [Bacillus mobilis]|uniref:DUF3278 domain-containing protein n=1 Tax=Bacillus mobilis TaxID=2026190 RepID=UPI002E1FF37C|nr:DUF3278 domain-containing protein [Bacillus mobilis]MED0957928.1 DUF3278 domain-containing protein [Bacillus mobilis]
MKSWLSILLPKDEYKKQKTLYFLAEASIILFITLIILFSIHRISPNLELNPELSIGMSISIFVIYIFTRYILSGIEYSNITTEKEFRKEKNRISFKSLKFILIFFITYSLIIGIPNTQSQWIDLIILILLSGIFIFSLGYISLRRSYKKNKDLLD